MVAEQQAALNLNGFDAMMDEPHPTEGWMAYAYSAADGSDFGNPEVTITAIASQLADGDLENVDRYGNREATFFICFTAPSAPTDPGRAIAMGQEALELALRFKGWAPLSWTDVLAGAETSVMEMTSATVSKDYDDETALFDGARVVQVNVHARPFVRPVEKVTIEAPPLPPSGTPVSDNVISNGSTFGWNAIVLHTSDTWSTSTTAWPGMLTVSIVHNYPDGGTMAARARWTPAIPFDPARPYIEIRGRADWFNGGGAHDARVNVTPEIVSGATLLSQSIVQGSTYVDFVLTLEQTAAIPANGLTVMVAKAVPGNAANPSTTVRVGIDSMVASAGPQPGVFTGEAQSRQVSIYGSQRTELSISVLGLDGSDAPVALGEQVLIHTASAGDDGRAKFIGCRDASGLAGAADPDAVTGVRSTLSTAASPTAFAFAASKLLPGEYDVIARLKGSAGLRTISYAATLDGTGSLDASDPVTGWYTAQVSVLTDYRIIPLGSLMLPPADIEDSAATLTVKVASDAAVDLDELWVAHRESGRLTLLDTNDPGISAVRLDAATVDDAKPSAWVGVATADGSGAMMSAASRIQAFDQHLGEPGLLQFSTVTPGCPTSRVSVTYYPKSAHDVAPRGWTPPLGGVG